jgi:hypothetical protein
LVLREHRDIGYLEDGAAIADDTTHAHGTPAMFDDDSEERVGKRNANDLGTTRREASPCTEGAVLRYGRVAYCDLVLLHRHFRSGAVQYSSETGPAPSIVCRPSSSSIRGASI